MSRSETTPVPKVGRPPTVAVADIIDVALELFGTRGIRATSVAAVAKRLGLTDAGVHHYFPTKAALLDAVVERAVQHQTAEMVTLVAPGGLEAIRRMSVWGTVMEQTPELVALQAAMSLEAITENSPITAQIGRRYQGLHELVVGLIRQGIANGDIRGDADADWEASAVVAYLDGIRLQWFHSGRTMPLTKHVHTYFDHMIKRLTANVDHVSSR